MGDLLVVWWVFLRLRRAKCKVLGVPYFWVCLQSITRCIQIQKNATDNLPNTFPAIPNPWPCGHFPCVERLEPVDAIPLSGGGSNSLDCPECMTPRPLWRTAGGDGIPRLLRKHRGQDFGILGVPCATSWSAGPCVDRHLQMLPLILGNASIDI